MEKLIDILFASTYYGESVAIYGNDGACACAVTAGDPVPEFFADVELSHVVDDGIGYAAYTLWNVGEIERAMTAHKFNNRKRRRYITAATAWCYE